MLQQNIFRRNSTYRARPAIRVCAIGLSIFGALSVAAPLSAQTDPFSLVCMPDPQYYTTSNHASLYNLYSKQSQWIKDNKANYNVQHVIWLGDLTNDNTYTQWNTANNAYRILDLANISYAVVPGNHDYKTTNEDEWIGANRRNLTLFNNIVGPQRFVSKSWYGGNMGNTGNHNENNYTYFSADGLDFLVIGLEYAPRKEVLTWANNLISQHPNHRVILFTHGYLTVDGKYVGGAGSAAGTVGASGQEIFDECASRHSNVFMVVCGHVTESKVNAKLGVAGNTIYEMLVDYQSEKVKGTGDNLGNGWLRVLKFEPAANRIKASTITVADGDSNIFLNGITQFYLTSRYSSSPSGIDHLFNLGYNMTAPMQPYTYLNASVGFHVMGVNNDLLGDQLDPDIAQADNDNWAAVWEDDDNDDSIYQIKVRGFDSDGNVRFDRSTVNAPESIPTNATNPSIAMAPDGRFVVVWQSGSTAIKMRFFSAEGVPVGAGDQTVISVPATGTVSNPVVAIDDSGNFVVAWADDADGNNYYQVRAQGFTPNYISRFNVKNVNTNSDGQQINPAITMAANGDYVITWEDDKDGTWDLNARGFLANETERFAQTAVSTVVDGEQRNPDIAMDDSGRFVVVWEDDADLNNAYQIKARGFSPTGTEIISERTVNLISAGNQINPSVAMDSTGNWYPVWQDNGVSGSGYQIMSNAYDISGTRLNEADVKANSTTSVSHRFGASVRKNPVVSAHKSGRYIVAWADDMEGDGKFQALATGIGGTAKSLVIKSINGNVARSSSDPFFAPNAQVTLTATGEPGYNFVRWSGDVSGGIQTANPLTITMDASKNLTAEFEGSSDVGDWPLY